MRKCGNSEKIATWIIGNMTIGNNFSGIILSFWGENHTTYMWGFE